MYFIVKLYENLKYFKSFHCKMIFIYSWKVFCLKLVLKFLIHWPTCKSFTTARFDSQNSQRKFEPTHSEYQVIHSTLVYFQLQMNEFIYNVVIIIAIDRLLLDGIRSLCYGVIQCLTPPPTSIAIECIWVHSQFVLARTLSSAFCFDF